MAGFQERRGTPSPGQLHPAYQDRAGRTSDPIYDPATGLHSLTALYEFIQYEIDGGAQTERHERFVTPLCVAAITADILPKLDPGKQAALTAAMTDGLTKQTRRADRVARQGNEFLALLRRTLAVKARDFYAPGMSQKLANVIESTGIKTTFSFGIASLTEHLVRGPEDMVKKALTALNVARKQGPGSVVVYDFRTMPY